MFMNIQSNAKDKILATPSETSKVENAPAEMLHDLDQQMEKRADDDNSKEWNSGDDQLRLRWMTYLVVLADAAESVRDAIRCRNDLDKEVLVKGKAPKMRRDIAKEHKLIKANPLSLRIGLVAYRLRLPEELNSVHDTFCDNRDLSSCCDYVFICYVVRSMALCSIGGVYVVRSMALCSIGGVYVKSSNIEPPLYCGLNILSSLPARVSALAGCDTKLTQASKGKRIKTLAKGDKPAKKKQSTTKSKGLTVLSEVALTEVEQMNISLERSKMQTHSSSPSGSGTNRRAVDKPRRFPMKPKYRSKSEEESWTFSQGEDDEENDEHDSEDDNDEHESEDDNDDIESEINNDDEADDQEMSDGEPKSIMTEMILFNPNLSPYKMQDDPGKRKRRRKSK
ncbi:hypothetical protein Tco_0798602 [Tanacetum coccineum]